MSKRVDQYWKRMNVKDILHSMGEESTESGTDELSSNTGASL
jgi:hypothetical protein